MLLAFSIRGEECQTSLRSLLPESTVPPKMQIKFPMKNPWCFLSLLPSIYIWKNWLLFLLKRKTSRCLLTQRTHLKKRIPDDSSFLLDLLTESINLESCENENSSQKHIFHSKNRLASERCLDVFFFLKESTLNVSHNLETTVSILFQKMPCSHHRPKEHKLPGIWVHPERILWLNLPNWC